VVLGGCGGGDGSAAAAASSPPVPPPPSPPLPPAPVATIMLDLLPDDVTRSLACAPTAKEMAAVEAAASGDGGQALSPAHGGAPAGAGAGAGAGAPATAFELPPYLPHVLVAWHPPGLGVLFESFLGQDGGSGGGGGGGDGASRAPPQPVSRRRLTHTHQTHTCCCSPGALHCRARDRPSLTNPHECRACTPATAPFPCPACLSSCGSSWCTTTGRPPSSSCRRPQPSPRAFRRGRREQEGPWPARRRGDRGISEAARRRLRRPRPAAGGS
jgi:hypothetical protein